MKIQCPYCGVGCGLLYENGKIKGDKDHIASKGELCKKPIYYPRTIDEGRILHPMFRKDKNDTFKRICWDEAFEIILEKMDSLKPDELYFYLSGQLLTEDIYVINKFVKGFLKTNNIDANSRLCMATPVAAYKLAFGSDGPPCSYEDLEDADSFLFVGSNAFWTHPVIFNRILRKKSENSRISIIVIDPVKTETAKKATTHIQLKASTDAILFNSVLYVLYKKGWIDWNFLKKHVDGYEKAIEEALKYPPPLASKICQIEEKYIHQLAELFAFSKKLISFWCQGINQLSSGVITNLSLINLHLATGRLNERGCPFSLTGQPNAMGGREMGYLSDGLPGYRNIKSEEDRSFVEDFWKINKNSINPIPGPTITQAIDNILKDEIKLMWLICTNPAVTLPNLKKVWKAFNKVFLIVQEAYWNDTTKYANLLLPAAVLGEKEGVMTGSDRTVTLCEKIFEPPAQAKPDWLIFKELAHRMGLETYFPYEKSEDIFNELKDITKGRLCDIHEFSYNELPKRWGGRWLYPDLNFKTDSGKAKMYPIDCKERKEDGFILTTGRTKNQWHTMTRTGKIPELLKGEEEPFLLINSYDAIDLGFEENQIVEITSEVGSLKLKLKFGDIKRKHLFAPFGYGFDYSADNIVNTIIVDNIDPISKEPEFKFTLVSFSLNLKKGE